MLAYHAWIAGSRIHLLCRSQTGIYGQRGKKKNMVPPQKKNTLPKPLGFCKVLTNHFPQIANFEKHKKTADPMGPTTCLERYVHPWCLQFFLFCFVFRGFDYFPKIDKTNASIGSAVFFCFSRPCSLSQFGVFRACKWLFATPHITVMINSLSKELFIR